MSRIARLFLSLSISSGLALAQPARFEVASIKPSKSGATVQDARMAFPPSRFDATSMTLREIVDSLNGMPTGHVEGGPKWVESDRYDIHAKSEIVLPNTALREAVLTLLQERFKLAIHQEAREEPGFALTLRKNAPNPPAAKEDEPTKVTSDAHKAIFQAVYMASSQKKSPST